MAIILISQPQPYPLVHYSVTEDNTVQALLPTPHTRTNQQRGESGGSEKEDR